MTAPITRTGEGLIVTLWTDGWPRSVTIEGARGDFRISGTEQLRALHFMLGEIIAADTCPNDRPKP